jgi:hypothetical protein
MIGIQLRRWITASVAVAAVAASGIALPAGLANADVCASVGRRVSVSGCTNLAEAPPPGYYAPLPQDFAPPPPPPPVNVCVGAGRRIHVSGCT